MDETFVQEFCSAAVCRANGLTPIRAKRVAPCIVRVADGDLTIALHSGELLLKAPASELEIVSPKWRKFATTVFIRINGQVTAVEFDVVYQLEKILTSHQRGILWGLQVMLHLSTNITYIPAIRLGRRLAAEFQTALLAAGAHTATP